MQKAKQFTLVSVLLLMMTACHHSAHQIPSKSVSRDLKEITDSGTLKVVMLHGSTSNFKFRGETMGYDYEMAQNLSHYLKLKLKITIAKNETEMVQLLQTRKADIVCASSVMTPEQKDNVEFVLAQPKSYQVLIQNTGIKMVSDVTELVGKSVYVKQNSIFHKRLKALNDEVGGGINIVFANDSISNEQLIEMVADKKIDYTLAYRNTGMLYKSYYNRLDCHVQVGVMQRNGWLIRKESKNLKRVIDEWQQQSDIQLLQTNLIEKYWELSPYFAMRRLKIPKGAISPYDQYFKKYATHIDWDWKLLAAVAYQESEFDPSQVSYAGAAGIMQLMPRTAADFGLNRNTIHDPERNIEAGVQYIKSLNMTFREVKNKDERIKFILAGYNVGPAHILDAMALAGKYGKNPHIWFGNVEYYLLKQTDAKYYRDKVVKYGYFNGKGSAQYVIKTLNTYYKYTGRK